MKPVQKFLLLIPLVITGGFLLYTWVVILLKNILAAWQHYLAALLYIALLSLLRKKIKKIVVATRIYLLLATFNLLALTVQITTTSVGVKIAAYQ